MPRPLRVSLPGALYCITSRAAAGQRLFRDASDYEAYLEFLGGYQRQYGFKLFAYGLLADCLCLLIELAPGTTISAVMHALNSRYTKHVTARYGHIEHVFQDRFHMTVMEKAPSLLAATLFIHRLPQDSGLAQDPAAWRWSSAARYLATGQEAAVQPACDEVLMLLPQGQDYAAALQAFSRAEMEQWRKALAQSVVGSDSFRQQVKAQAMRRSVSAEAAKTEAAAAPLPILKKPQPSLQPRLALGALAATVSVAALSLSMALIYATRRINPSQQASTAQLLPAAAGQSQPRLASLALPSRIAGTQWDIQMFASAADGAKTVQMDELQFGTGRVSSSALASQGFPASNYSLTLQPDGVVVWETMLTGKAGEVVCFRGEWNGQRMQGVMTRQLPGREAATFNFVGIEKPSQQALSRTAGQV